MKSENITVTHYRLELTEDEAKWLKGIMQNPLSENEDPRFEDPKDAAMRSKFWDALQ